MPRSRTTAELGLRADTTKLTPGLRRANRELEKTRKQTERLANRTRYLRQQQSRTLQTMRRFTAGLATLTAAFYLVNRAVRSFVGSLNTLQELENRLRVVTDSQAELIQTQQDLFDISKRTRSTVEANTRVFGRLALAADGTALSLNQVLQLTELIAKTQIIGGATAQEAFGSSIQFAQGIASNRLSGDELRGVLEGNPVLARVIARGLGVPVGQLRPLGQAGELTGDAVLQALFSQIDEVNRAFEDVTVTISSASTNVKTSALDLIGAFDDVTDISGTIVEGLKLFAEELDFITGLLRDETRPGEGPVLSDERARQIVADAIRAELPTITVGGGFLQLIRNELDFTEQDFTPDELEAAQERIEEIGDVFRDVRTQDLVNLKGALESVSEILRIANNIRTERGGFRGLQPPIGLVQGESLVGQNLRIDDALRQVAEAIESRRDEISETVNVVASVGTLGPPRPPEPLDEQLRLRFNRYLFEVLDRLAQQQPSVSSPAINRAAGIQAVRDLREARRLEGQAELRQGIGSLILTNPPVNEPLIQSITELTERLRELGTVFEDVNPDVAQHAEEVRQLGQNIAETLVEGIRQGASAVQIFGDIAEQILNRIIQQAITNPLAESIGDFLGSAIFGGVQGLGPTPAHSGGTVARGGFVRVGDAGPELVALPQGAYIHPRGNLMDSGGASFTINVTGVQDPTIVRREVERMYPEISRVAMGATVQALNRPSPLRRALN